MLHQPRQAGPYHVGFDAPVRRQARRPTKSASERGYDQAHRELRKRLLPLAWGKPCPLCGGIMLRSQFLDLDHSVPLAEGGGGPSRIAHRHCNRAEGVRIRARLRAAGELHTTRIW